MGGACRRTRQRHASVHENSTKAFPVFRMPSICTVFAQETRRKKGRSQESQSSKHLVKTCKLSRRSPFMHLAAQIKDLTFDLCPSDLQKARGLVSTGPQTACQPLSYASDADLNLFFLLFQLENDVLGTSRSGPPFCLSADLGLTSQTTQRLNSISGCVVVIRWSRNTVKVVT